MKQILMALMFTGLACISAQAQQGTGCKVLKPHKVAYHHRKALPPKETAVAVTTQESCRLLPYQVCTINPDRRTVSCFQTTDPDANVPLNNGVTTYGPDGALPGQPMQTSLPTVVIKGADKGDYCIRDEQNKETICYHQDGLLYRDEDGYYHYR